MSFTDKQPASKTSDDIKKIQCVILAGGLGIRLGAITKSTPKPAIKINGKPFILHKIDSLIECGFQKFLFLVSFESEKIIEVVQDYSKQKSFHCTFLQDQSQSGTFSAILNARKNLDPIFFYTNGDEISYFDIKKMYTLFCVEKALVSALVKKDRAGYLFVDKKLISKRVAAGDGTHIELGSKFVDAQIFSSVIFKEKTFEEYIYKYLLKTKKVYFFETDRLPIRIDTVNDLKTAKKVLLKNSFGKV